MKLTNPITGTATQSGFRVPALGGALAGVCPESAFRRVDGHAYSIAQVTFPTVAVGTVMGHRPWSPPIT